MPMMSIRMKGHRGLKRGHRWRTCDVCGHRCVYASKVAAELIELADREGGVRRFKAGTIVCNPCLKMNPGKEWSTNPLPVLTEEQHRREGRAAQQKRTRVRGGRRCRPCGGMGCGHCKGVGRIVPAREPVG